MNASPLLQLHLPSSEVNGPLLRVQSLGKVYRTQEHELTVLAEVSFSVAAGDF